MVLLYILIVGLDFVTIQLNSNQVYTAMNATKENQLNPKTVEMLTFLISRSNATRKNIVIVAKPKFSVV